ncbi:sugar transferase [Aeromicrobium sp. Marseille-Q0843]|uniref:Sugar transferase n=1 Tax=Aeromicrobium phoceense TaxID=2754045 RepID=A0A838XL00_9ACTN|nr:sugar transferase [Aeromicrobium phoceense]
MTGVASGGRANRDSRLASERFSWRRLLHPEGLHATRRQYERRVAISDLLVLLVVIISSEYVWLGRDADTIDAQFGIGYTKFGVLLTLVWWVALRLGGTRRRHVLGSAAEYQRIVHVTVTVFGVIAIVTVLLEFNLSRGYLAIAFPVGLTALLFTRRTWRRWRRQQLLKGRFVENVLVVGQPDNAREIACWFRSHPTQGLRVTGVWRPVHATESQWLRVGEQFIPIMGQARSLLSAVRMTGADAVIVSATDELGHHGLRDLTWELESAGIEMLLSPNLVAVAGSRIGMREVAGMPFVAVKEPTYAEAGNWPKLVFDWCGALVLLVMSSPILIATALAVKLSSPGPVFYRQERIGRDGEPFDMIKFRSMRVGADAELARLLEAQGTAGQPLFKVENDPRITRVGQFIRRYSIDELPQLLNVLRGDMSLVGPRPQRGGEVALYDRTARRRLRVRPGMTGLWQVSGRSNLSWEEAIALDMHYVENWTLVGDLQILVRTVKAVVAKDGAV